ncbi:MAG: AAA family ATPase [Polaromonas sp.]|nr:AAA family ATPase [Polaromonas sp.]
MKTSFTKTFEKLAKGELAEEERYKRPSTSEVLLDGTPLPKEAIYVLKSEIDIQDDSPAITDILVNPENKSRYDAILVDIDKQKAKLISALQKASGVPKKDIEKTLFEDIGIRDFPECIVKLKERTIVGEISHLNYITLFDPKAIEVLRSSEFVSNAKEFNTRYQELFSQEGSIYQKGIFNPARAETSFSTLDKQGFFNGGHRVQMRGEATAIGKVELDELLRKIHARIDGDEGLKKIRSNLAKNAQAQALSDLIENLPASQIDELLEKLRPEKQADFRQDLWAHQVQSSSDATNYIALYDQTKEEIKTIEAAAAQAAPKWTEAVDLFNDRFVDMPFSLSVANQTQAALGKEKAKLRFTFKDGNDSVEWSRSEIKTLSQGEKRALYLLNFIFEVEARSLSSQKTLFIIDDIADSFDYKNKHAIVQYLEDLDNIPTFFQIILTHNFDFFRTLANNFVHRERCLMANRHAAGVSLSKADGIKNYFIGILKEKVHTNPRVMCATIPFTRNLIEYTKGEDDPDYFTLTSLLHWKEGTEKITDTDYFDIYNRLFRTSHTGVNKPVKDLLHAEAIVISNETNHAGLNLEDKVLLSIAIRMKSEEFLIQKIRELSRNENYWCDSKNQFGFLMKEYTKLEPTSSALRTLEKVSITVSSNIHLNSFMYEPILDLTVDHLIRLYKEVNGLSVQ